MHFFCRLRFNGRLQQQTLNEALGVALARHPLLTAMVQDGRRRADRIGWRAGIRRPRCHGWSKSLRRLFRRQAFSIFVSDPACTWRRCRVESVRSRPAISPRGVRRRGCLGFRHRLVDGYANRCPGATAIISSPWIQPAPRPGRVAAFRLATFRVGHAAPAEPALASGGFSAPTGAGDSAPAELDAAGPPPAYPEAYFHHFTSEESAALAEDGAICRSLA